MLDPFAMVLYKHGLYVIGCARSDGEEGVERAPHVFAAERFEEVTHLRGEHFEVPASFHLDAYFQGAFGIFVGGKRERVVIEFAPPVRALVEARSWHHTQKLRPLAGGGVRLTFEVANLTQVVPWVLGWGPHAKVREPLSLVERVARELREAAAQYPLAPAAPPVREPQLGG